jgi:hypothetical protein
MTLELAHLGIGLAGVVVAVVLDCNRRVRELQRTSDLHTRWLDAAFHHRRDDDPRQRRLGPKRRRAG